MTEELTDYTNEQKQGIILFLKNDLEWYEAENNLNPIIASYLERRIEDFKEEVELAKKLAVEPRRRRPGVPVQVPEV